MRSRVDLCTMEAGSRASRSLWLLMGSKTSWSSATASMALLERPRRGMFAASGMDSMCVPAKPQSLERRFATALGSLKTRRSFSSAPDTN